MAPHSHNAHARRPAPAGRACAVSGGCVFFCACAAAAAPREVMKPRGPSGRDGDREGRERCAVRHGGAGSGVRALSLFLCLKPAFHPHVLPGLSLILQKTCGFLHSDSCSPKYLPIPFSQRNTHRDTKAVPRTNLDTAASGALTHCRTRSMPREPQGRAGLLLPAIPSFGGCQPYLNHNNQAEQSKQLFLKPLEIQVLVSQLLPASANPMRTKRHKHQLSPQTSLSQITVMCCCGASRDHEPLLFSTAPQSHRTYVTEAGGSISSRAYCAHNPSDQLPFKI